MFIAFTSLSPYSGIIPDFFSYLLFPKLFRHILLVPSDLLLLLWLAGTSTVDYRKIGIVIMVTVMMVIVIKPAGIDKPMQSSSITIARQSTRNISK